MSVYLYAAPPPLEPLEPPDKDSIQSSSFSVKLTKASNEKGIVRYVGGHCIVLLFLCVVRLDCVTFSQVMVARQA